MRFHCPFWPSRGGGFFGGSGGGGDAPAAALPPPAISQVQAGLIRGRDPAISQRKRRGRESTIHRGRALGIGGGFNLGDALNENRVRATALGNAA